MTAPADLQSLQGRWRVMALEIDGAPLPESLFNDARIQLVGTSFTSSGMGAIYRGTMALSDEGARKLFTLSFTDGPEAGRSNHGLYELDGNVWRFCLDMKGGVAPTSFSTSPGSGRALQTLARVT